MNEHRGRNALTVAGAVAVALAAASAGAETPATTNLGEVIVTAQKRSEALADIPMSVSVLPGDVLERTQSVDFQDLAKMIPGLSLTSNTAGITRITMRGINTGGVASTVGIYVNDVPFGSSSGLANAAILSGDFDTYDLARVEVLRGPQGTLYGASSLGGVIKYVSNEPSTDGFEGKAQASYEDVSGGDVGYNATGVLNLPAGENFAARVSAFYRHSGGYVDSIGNNPIPAIVLDPGQPQVNIVDGTRVEKNLNGSDVSGGRLSALLKPSENFSVDLSVRIQNINSSNANAYEVDPTTLKPLYGGLVASRYHDEWTDIEYRLYSATINWDLGGVSLESVTAFSEFSENFQRDAALLDAIGAGIGTAQLMTLVYSTFGSGDNPLSGIVRQTTATDKFTQELRLVSPDSDQFEWLLGAYYTNEHSGIDPQSIVAATPGTNDIAPGIPPLAEVSLTSRYEEKALFANATWHFTDRFDLSFGGRWSENDQEAAQKATIIVPVLLPGPIVQDFSGLKSSESPFTWSVSPRFEFSDTTSMYARAATGFRPGGPNVLPPGTGAPATYKSDKLTNYEIGLRTGTADGKYALDVAAFYLDWEDIQLFQVINNFGVNANGGKAKSQGVELTASAQLAEGFTLSLNGAYTNAALSEDTDPLVGGHDGDPLPWVPDWQFGLSGDYEWGMGTATAYVGGMVAYTGERMTDFSIHTPAGQHQFAGDYTTVDLRTGLLFDNFSVELYAKNVTNERAFTDIIAPGQFAAGAAAVAIIRPRTIGLSLGVKF
jgi:outer membrane receptor protein involved in Fe transport